MHLCPVVPKPPHIAPSIAKSRFASSITIIAFLPPISREHLFILWAQSVATNLPTSLEPVKETSFISLCNISGSPTSVPVPVTIFKTPFGSPASSKSFTKFTAESGVSEAGLKITVFPVTNAGAIFHDGIAIGKFHGVIAATIPTGIRTDMQNLFGSSEGVVSPNNLLPSPAT